VDSEEVFLESREVMLKQFPLAKEYENELKHTIGQGGGRAVSDVLPILHLQIATLSISFLIIRLLSYCNRFIPI